MRGRRRVCALLLLGTPTALSYHAVDKPCPMGSSGLLAVQPADDGMDNCTDASCSRKLTPAAVQAWTEESEREARAEVKEAEEAKAAVAKAAEAKAAEEKAAEEKAAEAKAAEAKAARAQAAEEALAEADEGARSTAEENDDAMAPCPTNESSVRKEVQTTARAAERVGYPEEVMNQRTRERHDTVDT